MIEANTGFEPELTSQDGRLVRRPEVSVFRHGRQVSTLAGAALKCTDYLQLL